MEVEIKLSKQELQKISLDFRTVANRLIRTRHEDGISNLKRFIKHLDSNPIINKFIQQHNSHQFNIESIISNYPYLNNPIPDESEAEEISFIYQILKYALKKYDYSDGYLHFAGAFCGHSGKIQEILDRLNSIMILPFYNYIANYISKLQIDMGDDENARTIIQVQGDNYGNNLGFIMNEMNIDQSNSSIGVGVNQGEISAEKLAGIINETEKASLDKDEIIKLVEVLRQQLEALPSDNQDVAVDSLETLQSEIITPTKPAKVKSALFALWSVGKDVATFGNAVSAIAERLGIHLIS